MNREQFFDLFYKSMQKSCANCIYLDVMGEMKACRFWEKILLNEKGCAQWRQK